MCKNFCTEIEFSNFALHMAQKKEGKKSSWYVLYTRPRWEKKAETELKAEGISTYLPLVKTLRQWSDRKKLVEVPLLPSYIFVNIKLNEYETVRRARGIVNFVYYRSKPAVVRDEEIEALQEFLGKTKHSSIEFVEGDEVRVRTGVLGGKQGTIKKIGKERVLLIIDELNMALQAEIDKSLLDKV